MPQVMAELFILHFMWMGPKQEAVRDKIEIAEHFQPVVHEVGVPPTLGMSCLLWTRLAEIHPLARDLHLSREVARQPRERLWHLVFGSLGENPDLCAKVWLNPA